MFELWAAESAYTPLLSESNRTEIQYGKKKNQFSSCGHCPQHQQQPSPFSICFPSSRQSLPLPTICQTHTLDVTSCVICKLLCNLWDMTWWTKASVLAPRGHNVYHGRQHESAGHNAQHIKYDRLQLHCCVFEGWVRKQTCLKFFFLIRIKRKRFFLTICKVVYNQALSAKHSLNMLYVSPTISPCGNESMINFVMCMLRKLKVLGYSFGIKTGCVCFFSYFTKTTYFPNINKRDSIVRALQFVSSAPTTSMTSLWDGNMAVCGLEKPCHWTESRQEFSITLLG